MANTVYHYAPTSWTNGTTPVNATNMNHLETGPLDALSGLNPDLFTAFVFSGIVCTKDGSTANQLDIASGRAYVTQGDGTIALIVVASDNTHTTVTPTSTYHLYLQPDGTWYWSTSNSPASNSLAICSVTTDGSGNISVVTDLRPLSTTLLTSLQGTLKVPTISAIGPVAAAGFGVPPIIAQAIQVHVTTTAATTILTFTVPADGLYRLSGSLFTANGGTYQPNLTFTYTSRNGSFGPFTLAANGSGGNIYNGATTFGNQIDLPVLAECINAKNGTAFTVTYTNTAGTPNDFVSAVVERLA